MNGYYAFSCQSTSRLSHTSLCNVTRWLLVLNREKKPVRLVLNRRFATESELLLLVNFVLGEKIEVLCIVQ
jgi:hypothetical protein